MTAAMLVDTTRCIGCNACAEACKEANALPGEIEARTTARTWTVVEERNGVFVRRMCMHCQEPSCVSVCPVAALYTSERGPVAYDEGRCIGCRYCMAACPFQVPKYEWDAVLPRVQKCIGCLGRIERGDIPACAAACPAEASVFGEREALLSEARRRIAADPDAYIDHIYGENEVGGTNVLVLAGVPFASLGFPLDLPEAPLPDLTWQALSKIPSVVSIGGLALLGVWWIVHRRMELERRALVEAAGEGAADSRDLDVAPAGERRAGGGAS